jgi:predicted nuclease of predicted toxin-antitoxin system
LTLLAAAGHNVVHVGALDLVSTPDPVILARAADEQRVLVTLDTDFGALVAYSQALTPSIVLFRGNVTRRSDRQATLLLANLDQIAEDLDAGAVVVIGDGRLRIRRLPID